MAIADEICGFALVIHLNKEIPSKLQVSMSSQIAENVIRSNANWEFDIKFHNFAVKIN